MNIQSSPLITIIIAVYNGAETLQQCIDSVLDQYTSLSDNLFIKIDTQGYEWAVLDGAAKALNQSKGVLLELSLVPLYDGQKLWIDCIERLKKLGISLCSIQPGFTDLKTGQTLQVDGLFFKSKESIEL